LATLTLKTRRADSLLEAVTLLNTLNTEQDTTKELQNAPIDFVPGRWRSRVVGYDGSVKRRAYELCALSELRDNLRAGEVWLDSSRRYADIESYLIPREQWTIQRTVFCEMVNLPVDGQQYIAAQTQALQTELSTFDDQLATLEQVRIENDKLVLSPLKKQHDDDMAEQLSKQIGSLLPIVYTGELLAEVDQWCGFSQEMTHAGGSVRRADDMPRYLYAILLSGASNIDLEHMAELASLSHSRMVWYANWFMREETLQRATDVLVNFHLHQPFSQVWGSGTLSSSDGQRFAVSHDVLRAAPLPRYFGYGRGLSFITWVADQYSQYGIRVTPPTMREATYVLDAILENESDLSIEMHTTDTAGYTDLIFALFDLLGMQFAPRLKDIGDRKLYCPDKSVSYKNIATLIGGELKSDLYVDDYDDMLRLVASLKMGRVTASTLVSKLQAYPRQHHLTRVLQEYGKLVRTRFILRYLADTTYQRLILKQLNKGESVHRLRRFLMFDHLGQLRKPDIPSIINQAGCLNLVTNAIVVWNTVYMQAAVESLRSDGTAIEESLLTQLSPIRFKHIFPYGRFFFDIQEELESTGLRPLRKRK
jgi:TnpA family transposase